MSRFPSQFGQQRDVQEIDRRGNLLFEQRKIAELISIPIFVIFNCYFQAKTVDAADRFGRTLKGQADGIEASAQRIHPCSVQRNLLQKGVRSCQPWPTCCDTCSPWPTCCNGLLATEETEQAGARTQRSHPRTSDKENYFP